MANPWDNAPIVQKAGGIMLADPYKPREDARADRQLAISAGQLANSQANTALTAQRQNATLPADIRKAEADAQKAELATQAAAKEQALAPKPETARIQTALQTDNVLNLLNTARQQVGGGYSTGNFFGSRGFQSIPVLGQNSTDLDATLTGIGGNVIKDVLAQLKAASATGASGFGSLTEREGQLLQSAVGALQQKQSAESLMRNLAAVELHYRNSLALLNNEDPRQPEIQQKYGIISQSDRDAAVGARAPQGDGKLTSEGKIDNDPGLQGVNTAVSRMIQSGQDAGAIRSYLNSVRPGLGDKATGVEEAVQFGRQNPAYTPTVDVEKVWVPATSVQQTMGDIGMSPFGAGAIGAADMATFGTLDNMTGNPALSRAVMSGVQQENPTSYTLGQIVGGVGSGIGLESAVSGAGLRGAGGNLVADALLGAGYGAGTADNPSDSRVSGALLGAGLGAAGGAAGRVGTRVAGRALTGVQDAARQALNTAGVRMTPGQILGGTIQRTEDRLGGLPFVGDAIRARRMEGVQDFNRAAFGEAVSPIGAQAPADIGFQGVTANQGAISQAYRNALGGVNIPPDAQFGADLGQAVGGINNIPRVGPEVSDSIQNIVSDPAYYPGGVLPGENMQAIMQELRGLRSGYANDPLGNRVGEGVRSVEDALSGLVERQAPGVMNDYRAADAAYRGQSIVDDAVLRGQNQGGVFTPAQLGMSMKANTKAYGGKRAAARGDMPFQQLQQAGQEVLPSTVPDSGTAGRLVIPSVVGALASGGSYAAQDGQEDRGMSSLGVGAVAAALAAAPYSAAARNTLQRVLLSPRSQRAQSIGELLLNNDRVAGLLTAPAIVEAGSQ